MGILRSSRRRVQWGAILGMDRKGPDTWRRSGLTALALLGLCFSLAIRGEGGQSADSDLDTSPRRYNTDSSSGSRHLLTIANANETVSHAPVWEQCDFEKRNYPGAWLFNHTMFILVIFIALAIVCDDFFVPSLEAISDKLQLSEDVAGATFMAAGSSAPELFTSVAGVAVETDVGVGTIVGSAVFNILIIIALTAALAGKVLHLDWRPLIRDSFFYAMSIACFIGFSWDGFFVHYEAAVLLALYIIYIILMAFNPRLMEWMGTWRCGCVTTVLPVDEENVATTPESPDHNIPETKATVVSQPKLRDAANVNGTKPIASSPKACGQSPKDSGFHSHENNSFNYASSDNSRAELHRGSAIDMELQNRSDVIQVGGATVTSTPTEDGDHATVTVISSPRSKKMLPPLANHHNQDGPAMNGNSPQHNLYNQKDPSDATNNNSSTVLPPISKGVHLNGPKKSLTPDDPISEEQPKEEPATSIAEEEEDEEDETMQICPCLPCCPAIRTTPPSADMARAKGGCWPWFKFVLRWVIFIPAFPFFILFSWTIPDCSKDHNKKWFLVSFFMSVLWIAALSFGMVTLVSRAGCILNIDTYTMGLVIIAMGTSIPDAMSSVLVARDGYGDMAVSNAIGSNVFDINLGLGLPFIIRIAIDKGKPISLLNSAEWLDYHTARMPIIPHAKFGFILLIILVIALISFTMVRFRLNKAIGVVFVFMYILFLAYTYIQELYCNRALDTYC